MTIPTTVRHLSKDHLMISPAPGYSVTVFNLKGGNIEAIVAADDGTETIRLLVAGPTENQDLALQYSGRDVNFFYTERT